MIRCQVNIKFKVPYIYRHIRLDTNVPFYIGIGSEPFYRRATTKRYRNKIWNRIANKTEYAVEILFDDVDWEFACAKEKELIALYGKMVDGTGTLSNVADGGEGTFGVFHSDETKRKITIARKTQLPTNAIPVIKYGLDGKFICIYESANDAARATGLWAYQITAACRGTNGVNAYKSFVWRHRKDALDCFGNILMEIDFTSVKKYLRIKPLTESQIFEIKNSLLTNKQLGEKYGVSSTTIFYAKKGVPQTRKKLP